MRPQKHRQFARLGRSIGMFGNPQENSSQPLEIYDSEDEQPPWLEGGENEEEEEELEENTEEEPEEEIEHSGEEEWEEAEPPSWSPLWKPL